MKVERHYIEETTIEAFADKYGLVMEVHERMEPDDESARYYAHFKCSDARDGAHCLIGLFGNGRTPEEAIANYAIEISQRVLIIDALRETRREIQVPRVVCPIPPP